MVADSVDVNPAVVDAARRFFEFEVRGRTFIEDGRTFVRRAPVGSYDVIVLDAFNGEAVPYHLMTREFLSEAGRLLRPGGVLAVNAIGLVGTRTGLSVDVRSISVTLRAAFPHVRAFRLPSRRENVSDPAVQNVLLFAGQSPAGAAAARDMAPRRASDPRSDDWPPSSEKGIDGGGIVLSDDYNPIDFLNAETAQELRRRTLAMALEDS